MEKILLLILVFLLSKIGFTQYPITQNLASDSSIVRIGATYNGSIKGGLINMSFGDTSAANLSRISFYTGAQIWTNTDSSLWVRKRSSYGSYWFKIGGAGSGPSGSSWNVSPTGQLFPVTRPYEGIGTSSVYGGSLGLVTNGLLRVLLPNDGLERQVTTGAFKYMLFDTINKTWGYGDNNSSSWSFEGDKPYRFWQGVAVGSQGIFTFTDRDSVFGLQNIIQHYDFNGILLTTKRNAYTGKDASNNFMSFGNATFDSDTTFIVTAYNYNSGGSSPFESKVVRYSATTLDSLAGYSIGTGVAEGVFKWNDEYYICYHDAMQIKKFDTNFNYVATYALSRPMESQGGYQSIFFVDSAVYLNYHGYNYYGGKYTFGLDKYSFNGTAFTFLENIVAPTYGAGQGFCIYAGKYYWSDRPGNSIVVASSLGAKVTDIVNHNFGRITAENITSHVYQSKPLNIWGSQYTALGYGSTFTEKMRINSSGVGVGITPTVPLHVHGGTSSPIAKFESSTASQVWSMENGRFHYSVASNGFGSIQVTNTLTGQSAASGALFTNDVGKTMQLWMASSINSNTLPNEAWVRTQQGSALRMVSDSGFLAFHAGGKFAERMRITSSGLIGIATTTPDSTLTVDTSLHVKRGVRFSGIPTFADTTNYKPVVINSSGTLYKATYWPGGGSSGLTVGSTAISGGTAGRILFQGSGNVVQQEAGLYWNEADDELDIIGGGNEEGLNLISTNANYGTHLNFKYNTTTNAGFVKPLYNGGLAIGTDGSGDYIQIGGILGVDGKAKIQGYVYESGGIAAEFNTNNATTVGISIDGYASQTADLMQYRNSSGTVLTNVDKDGHLNLGLAGSIKGEVTLSGNTSGTVTIQPAAAAGTYTLTLPTTDGNDKEVLTTDGSGVTSWSSITTEGTYTPTLTNTTNISSSTAGTTYYVRIGDWVHVWGDVSIDATTALSVCEMDMSLPIASGISNSYQLAGTAAYEDNTAVLIKGASGTNVARWRFTPQTNTNNKYSFTFSYKYIAP